jgi:methionyl aminopeptidase
MLPENVLECYKKAGKITAEIRELSFRIVHEGMPILAVCEELEKAIKDRGGKPAFPVNIGINEVAAHYTSPFDDSSVIPPKSIVKIDFGVHINGFIADSAITTSFNPEYYPMVSSAEQALKEAIENMRPGVKISEIGGIIQRAILNRGFKPISNLTGHKVERYVLHTGKSLPNIPEIDGARIAVDEVFAVEPFVTVSTAEGRVESLDRGHIFRFNKEKGVKTQRAKDVLRLVREEYRSLPFALRWLRRRFQGADFDAVLQELISSRCLVSYPVLIEASSKPVAQAEHTVVITEKGCEVLTA